MESAIEQTKAALRIEEFALLYGLSRAQVYNEINAGRLVARKAGTRTLIGRHDADAWLAALPAMPARGSGKAA
jgi:excisionase family DNA binding protein